MTSDRVYRKGLSKERAFEELERFSGSQFDPDAAQAFIKAHQEMDAGRAIFLEDDKEPKVA